jgi:hypothetical protein
MTMRRFFPLATLLAVATFGMACGTRTALAQSVIDARCLKVKDTVGCTCALAFGGTMTNGSWAPARGADKRAIEQCVLERGGKAKAKPPMIPGRY